MSGPFTVDVHSDGLRIRFECNNVVIFHMQLLEIGYRPHLRPVGEVQPARRGVRWDLVRQIPPVTEWITVDEAPTEVNWAKAASSHGFVVRHQIPCHEDAGWLVLRLAVLPEHVVLRALTENSAMLYNPTAGVRLKYERPVAKDIRGFEPQTRLSAHDQSLWIEVKDTATHYPLTIGPPASSPGPASGLGFGTA